MFFYFYKRWKIVKKDIMKFGKKQATLSVKNLTVNHYTIKNI